MCANGSLIFLRARREVGAVADDERGVGLELAVMVRRHERVETMRFLGHQDGETLAAASGSVNRNLISMPSGGRGASSPARRLSAFNPPVSTRPEASC